MQIIFSRQVAEELQDRYTVLELETFVIDDKTVETFCVVPGEKIHLGEMMTLENDKKLHADLVTALKDKNYKICKDLIDILKGKFGGEVDSFYDIILERCNANLV